MAESGFEQEFLHTHNTYRKQHGAPPLVINRDLCRSAQAWAEHLLSIKALKHSQAEYGENLYYAWSSRREAVDSWYSEIKDYNFKRPGFTSGTGHFTQVVWKDTKELGFGVATDGATIFVVGQYLPAGNISNFGYFEKNVLPSGSPVDRNSATPGPVRGVGEALAGLKIQPNKIPSQSGLDEKKPSGDKHSNFAQGFLQTHNTYRKQHGAPPLTINQDLCRSAQAWAEHLLSIKKLKHSQAEYGENLYYAWSSGPKTLTGKRTVVYLLSYESVPLTGCEAVDSWYSEIKDYNFKKPGFTSGTGHFTQVVWKDTKEVGYGVATDGAAIFVVGQYLPAGNITNPGYFEKNVLPSGSPVDSKSTTSGPVGGVAEALGGLGNRTNKFSSHSGSTEKESSGNKANVNNSSFEKEFLQTHNTYRKQHGAPPLTVNQDLCRSAQAWAEHLLSIKTLKHSQAEYGENLYYAWSSGPKTLTGKRTVVYLLSLSPLYVSNLFYECLFCPGREAVDSWYSEIKDYNFKRPGFTSGTGHFTQVVWKDTKEVGYGLATDGSTIFVVGQYLPAGNITNPGYFEKNVLPSGSPVDSKSTTSGPVDGVRQGLPSGTAEKVDKGENPAQFSRQLLEAINQYRQRHGVPNLSKCPTLSKEAQEWADHLVSIKTLKNSQKGHGETMSYKWTNMQKAPTAEEVAEKWYGEGSKYDFSTPAFQSGTGNFTQMVWKSSERAGIGLATDGQGLFITVAFYEPAGNITNPGYFKDNVIPARR
ncbi:hypothetical protein NFI96_024292 [Prochilodus magdalenae]|nr:hypothetical protein NFI96_024292 [Prochilodus magdalenae]